MLRAIWLAVALLLSGGGIATAQIGIMGAPSNQCLQSILGLNNTTFPGGVATGTKIGLITLSTNATLGGQATWDTSYSPTGTSGLVYSNGNLTIGTGPGAANGNARSTTAITGTPKLYWAVTMTALNFNDNIGITNASIGPAQNFGPFSAVAAYQGANGATTTGNGLGTTIQTSAAGDTVQEAFDFVHSTMWFRTIHSGVAGNWNNSGSANPSTNTGGIAFSGFSGPFYAGFFTDFTTSVNATLVPSPLTFIDGTLAGFSPLQPATVISCNPATLSLSGANSGDFQFSTTTPPAFLETNGTVPAGSYSATITSATTGAQNSPISLPQTITGTAGGVEDPGPSSYLYAHPFYTCVRNFYVATTGNDSNAGTIGSPWLTIQHADSTSLQPGDCINVASGTYAAGLAPTKGGNAASATGYVVYRCTTLDACTITATGAPGAASGLFIDQFSGPNYLIIDGFELAASSAANFANGITVTNGNESQQQVSSHHIWVLNNLIHGFGQGGLGMNDGEYFYVIHNTVYSNSSICPSNVQGSGISFAVLKAVTGYSPTAADTEWGTFHNVIAWNSVHDNILTSCGNSSNPIDTDGNGIILDTLNNQGSTNVSYPFPTLIASNVVYKNGGAGITNHFSNGNTIVNNTAYDNYLDPYNIGTARGEINNSGSQNTIIQNNIAEPVPATSSSDARCNGVNYPSSVLVVPCPLQLNGAIASFGLGSVTNFNTTINNNQTFGGTPPFGYGPSGNVVLAPDTMNCLTTGVNQNFCNIDPLLTSPSTGNFALQSSSAAIARGIGGITLYSLVVGGLGGQWFDLGPCYNALTSCP